jgi:haloalkane dehalogenase
MATSELPDASIAARAGASLMPVPDWLDREAYPFTPRAMRVSEGTVSYIDEGHGDPVLFVHGTPTWSFEYRHLIRELSATHRCVAVDHLGFGLSERPADFPYTPEAHARVLSQVVDRLGLERFTLVAHDFGGPIALPLALETPERVRNLTLVNTWMWSLADDPAMQRAARIAGSSFGRFLYRRMNFSLRVLMPQAYGDRSKLTRQIHQQYLAPFADTDARELVLWALAHALLGSSEYFDSLWQRRGSLAQIPALVVWGTSDRALPPALLGRWREALPQAHIVELEGAGHWPHEEMPTEVTARVKAFLA